MEHKQSLSFLVVTLSYDLFNTFSPTLPTFTIMLSVLSSLVSKNLILEMTGLMVVWLIYITPLNNSCWYSQQIFHSYFWSSDSFQSEFLPLIRTLMVTSTGTLDCVDMLTVTVHCVPLTFKSGCITSYFLTVPTPFSIMSVSHKTPTIVRERREMNTDKLLQINC